MLQLCDTGTINDFFEYRVDVWFTSLRFKWPFGNGLNGHHFPMLEENQFMVS